MKVQLFFDSIDNKIFSNEFDSIIADMGETNDPEKVAENYSIYMLL